MAGPTFLGIGAQKAATTWLHVQLAAHPEVATHPGPSMRAKERHFWCRSLHRRTGGGTALGADMIDAYLESFPPGVTGEITPHYGVLDDAAVDTVRSHLPAARILYVLRNPIDRAWSAATSRLAPGFDLHRATLQRWDGEDREGFDLDEGRLRRILRSDEVVANSDAATTLRRWRRCFGDDAVLVLRYEQVAASPRDVVAAAYRHIGVDPGFADAIAVADLGARIDPHRPAPVIPARFGPVLERVYGPLIERLETYLGEDLSAWRRERA